MTCCRVHSAVDPAARVLRSPSMHLGAHDRPTRAVTLTVVTVVLAAALLDQLVRVHVLRGDGSISSVAFPALAVLLVLTETRPTAWTRVGERNGVARGWPFAYALILLGNPVLAITVMVATRCYVNLERRKSPNEIVYDSAQIVASLSLGSLVLAAFEVHGNIGDVGTITIAQCVGIVTGGVSIFVVNGLLSGAVIGLEQDAGLLPSTAAAFRLSSTADGALLALAPVFVIAADSPLVIAVLLIVAMSLLVISARSALRRDPAATPLLLMAPIEADAVDQQPMSRAIAATSDRW